MLRSGSGHAHTLFAHLIAHVERYKEVCHVDNTLQNVQIDIIFVGDPRGHDPERGMLIRRDSEVETCQLEPVIISAPDIHVDMPAHARNHECGFSKRHSVSTCPNLCFYTA